MVVTGDITQNGSREDLLTFIRIVNDLKAKGVSCYPVAGNHDVYFNNWLAWKDLIGSTSYRVDHDTASLFVLDSASAFFGSVQLDWLESELKSAQNPVKDKVFVFSHANLFVETPLDLQQFTDIRERARTVSLLKNRCDAVFMGHIHKRIITETAGVKYITLEDFVGNSTYCRVKVSSAGISWQFVKL